ncbi:hypothetical protein [Streptomyces sp. NRRL S-337]|uniref:hypothetical protein n=1 Tax=Streptomyces sp. NRRL S-337 TaxID=1463900 RepID=UPI000B33D05F|nr:hypothetical protein [Streptomyces sp. NRRL S-337]
MTVGAGAGLGSIAFRWLIVTFTHLFSGHGDYAGAGGSANPHVLWLGPFVRQAYAMESPGRIIVCSSWSATPTDPMPTATHAAGTWHHWAIRSVSRWGWNSGTDWPARQHAPWPRVRTAAADTGFR